MSERITNNVIKLSCSSIEPIMSLLSQLMLLQKSGIKSPLACLRFTLFTSSLACDLFEHILKATQPDFGWCETKILWYKKLKDNKTIR